MAQIKIGNYCPRIHKNCIEHKCRFYIMVRGTNPNTGQEVDDWGCTDAFMPMLTIENTLAVRELGAAIESFRNEMVRMNMPSYDPDSLLTHDGDGRIVGK